MVGKNTLIMTEEIRMVLWRGDVNGCEGRLTAYPLRLRDGVIYTTLFWQPYDGEELRRQHRWWIGAITSSRVGLAERFQILVDDFMSDVRKVQKSYLV